MGEPKNLGLAAAVAGGYLLGRGKKGQMALTAAAVLAGRGLRPGALVAGGLRKVPGVPDTLKGGGPDEGHEAPAQKGDSGRDGHGALSRAARGAASSVANRGVTALSGALHERTLALGDEPHDDEGGGSAVDAGVGADEDESAEENADEGEAPGSEERSEQAAEPAAPRRAPKKPGPRSATSKKSAARKQPAKRTADKSAPIGKEPARKKRTVPKKPAAPKAPAGKKPSQAPKSTTPKSTVPKSTARKTTEKKSQTTRKAAPRTRRER